MENKDYLQVFILIAGSVYGLIIYSKRKKVSSEKEKVEQQIQLREEQLKEEQPEVPLSVLCKEDPE